PLSLAFHLGHHRGAQGGPLLARSTGGHRQHRGPDVRALVRRRVLRRHAHVPLQRAHGRLGTRARGWGDRRPPSQVLGIGLPARFDDKVVLLNADQAIGELVNRLGTAGFEGYWRNDEATAARTRDGMYWTGDLAYKDEQGFVYFAGRDFEWLRVDGENFAA